LIHRSGELAGKFGKIGGADRKKTFIHIEMVSEKGMKTGLKPILCFVY